MNMESGTEAALFPEKEYISGIFLEVWWTSTADLCRQGRYFATTNGLPEGWVDVHHRCGVDSEEREGCFFSCVGAALQQRAALGSFLQEVGASTNPVFSVWLGTLLLAVLAFAFRYMLEGLMDLMFLAVLLKSQAKFFIFIALPIIYFLRWILFFILKTTNKTSSLYQLLN